MADIDPRISTPAVTTGPIRGSRKVHVGPLKVAMRAIDLEPSAGEPPLNVYDPSGPYTDAAAAIDIDAGLPELRRDWIRGRGDVEEVAARETGPRTMASLARPRRRGRPLPQRPPPRASRQARAERQPDALCAARNHHARDGICRDPRESGPRSRDRKPRPRRRKLRRRHPRFRHPRIRPRRSGAGPRDHPRQHQSPRNRADGDRPQLPGQDQRQYRQLGGRQRRRRGSRQDGVVDPLGRGHGDGPVDRPQHPRHARMDHPQHRPCRSAPCRSTRRWRRSAALPRS